MASLLPEDELSELLGILNNTPRLKSGNYIKKNKLMIGKLYSIRKRQKEKKKKMHLTWMTGVLERIAPQITVAEFLAKPRYEVLRWKNVGNAILETVYCLVKKTFSFINVLKWLFV